MTPPPWWNRDTHGWALAIAIVAGLVAVAVTLVRATLEVGRLIDLVGLAG